MLSTSQTDTVVPLEINIAREVVKDLERYDFCLEERESLIKRNSILKKKIELKDSINTEYSIQILSYDQMLSNYKKKERTYKEKIENLESTVNKRRAERNLALIGGVAGIIGTFALLR